MADVPVVDNLWPNNWPKPEGEAGDAGEALDPELQRELEASLAQDLPDQARQLTDHQRSMDNLMVPDDKLDADLQQQVTDHRTALGQPDIDNPSWLAKTLDVPAQATNGFFAAANSMKDLIFDVSGEGAKLLYSDALGMATPEEVAAATAEVKGKIGKDFEMPFGDPKSGLGAFAKPVGQFLAPFGAFSKLKYVQALGKAAPMAAGALSDFVSFGEHEQRLSNMINEVPALKNPVTEYLAADPNDSWAEGRFKNAVEGTGLGLFTDAVFHGVRYMRDGIKARKQVADMRAASGPVTQEIRAGAGEVNDLKGFVGAKLRGQQPAPELAAKFAQDVTPPAAPMQGVSAAERDAAIRTIFGEASNQGAEGWQAVANVMLNRKTAGKYGADLEKIAKKKNQFEPWNNPEARARLEALDPNSAEYKAIGDVFDKVAKGELPDNTGGATHFLQRALQEKLGRNAPKWANQALSKIGDHEFFSPDGKPISGRVPLPSGAPMGAETMAGFRPNREQMDLATQARLAAANGTTLEQLNSAKVFENIRSMGVQDQLNKVTQLEEQQFTRTGGAAVSYLQRLDAGDVSAADEFWRNEGAAWLEVAGNAKDAFQDVARAQGFRGNSAAVVSTNELLRRITSFDGQTKEGMLRIFAQLTTPAQLDSFVSQVGKKGLGKVTNDTLKEWYTNAILSSPKTQLVDIAGSALWTPWLALEKVPAGLVGKVRAGWTGSADRVYMDEAGIMLGSYMGSLVDGLSMVGKALKSPSLSGALDGIKAGDTGGAMKALSPFDTDMLGDALEANRVDVSTRFDGESGWQRAISAENYGVERDTALGRTLDWAGTMVNMPASFMRNKDDLTKAMLYRAEVRALAHRRALNENLTGDAYYARVNALQSMPLDKAELATQSLTSNKLSQLATSLKTGDDSALIGAGIETEARDFARQGTFTNDLGPIGDALKNVVDKIPGGWLVAPFIKTPINILTSFLERTPAAPVFASVRADLAAGGAKADLAMGRMVAGTSAMTLGWYFAASGMITGDGPKDPAQREALQRTGWRPRSIKVGDKYIEYGRMDPIASFLQIPANIIDLNDQMGGEVDGKLQKDLTDYMTIGGLAMGSMLKSKTFTQGVGEWVDAINSQDERAVNRMARFYAANAVVPNAVTFFANEVNPQLQEANNVWEAIQIKAGVTVRPKLDVWGQPVKRDPQLYYGLPASYSNITTDALEQELAGAGVFLPKPDRKIENVELDPDQYHNLLKTMGEMRVKDGMRKLTESPLWKQLPDVVRTGEDGAQEMTKTGVASNLYRQYVKAAKLQVLNKDVTLQRRILQYQQAQQNTSPTPRNVTRALDAQGAGAPISVDFGL